MALKGALNRGANLLYGLVLTFAIGLPFYSAYRLGIFRAKEVLADCIALVIGAVAGLPAFLMNRTAVTELYDTLDNKFFLSSQLALLESRHGKNALAYFYFVATVAFACTGKLPGVPDTASACFAYGVYLSANVFPFLFGSKRPNSGASNTGAGGAGISA